MGTVTSCQTGALRSDADAKDAKSHHQPTNGHAVCAHRLTEYSNDDDTGTN